MRFVVSILLLTSILSGCAATLQAQKPDPTTGLYATRTGLEPKDVRIMEKFDPKYTDLVYLKVDDEKKIPQFTDFFSSALKETHVFKKVVTKDDLQQIVIERNLGNKVSNVSDLVGLNNLSKEIGPYLIVETTVVWLGGYRFEGKVTAIDASTGKTVLLIDKTAFNLAGLDEPLFNPLLNGFVNWTHDRPLLQKGMSAE